MKEFYAGMPEVTTYFDALFEVSGKARTDISCELVRFDVLEI
ncbi:hypothetical protein [Labilibaculum antarcticum]|nr:hypothetical protein [Labilibaculum antarcticum]